jgi:hypothetical protein
MSVVGHPTRALFVTAGDDTFLNVYEVDGGSLDKLEVKLLLSSRTNDLMMVGVQFAGEGLSSIIAVPYDFSTLVIWNAII